jgi:4-amino-4-deoxy-L-arabinose transferase-like glycosyltransferase
MDATPAQGQVCGDMPRQLKVIFLLLLVLVGTGLLSLWSDFPYFYHTDEPGKARQIIEGSRNLHHPPLMLESANLLVRVLGRPLEPQAVTETGRLLSAIFCALAAALLTLTLAAFRPWPEAMLAGVLLLFQPDVQEYARFFKEDPSLMFGWAAVFAAMAFVEKKPGRWSAMALGAAVALAASAKYVGIVMILPAAWILLISARRGKEKNGVPAWKNLHLPAMVAFIILLAAINHRLWLDPSTFRASLGKETTLVLEGQGDVTQSIPHSGSFERLLNRLTHLLPFVALGWWTTWKQRRELGTTVLLLVLSPWALALLLAFSAKDSGRYFMPGTLGLVTAATLGVGWLCRLERFAKIRVPIAATCALLVLGASLGRCWSYFRGFQSDPRKEMLVWMTENLPPGSRVLQGRKVTLPDSTGLYADAWHLALPQHIHLETCKLVSSVVSTPADARARGFTHIALAGDEYKVYTDDNKAKSAKADEFARRRAFYEALFRDGRILWERPSGKVGTHQPPLRLVELPHTIP